MPMKRSLPGAVMLALMAATPAAAQPPSSPAAVPLDQKAADSFAGYFQAGPGRAVRFWREGTHFYFGAVGTPQKAEAVPIAANTFAFQNGAITFTFAPDAAGRIALTLNQAGRDVVMPRITEDAANALAASAKAPPPPVMRTWAVKIVLPRTLTTAAAGGVDYWPCFAADGSILFSRSPDGGKTWSLYRIPAAENPAQILFARDGLPATRASIGPAGRIAFNAGNGIWIMDGTGGNARAVPLKDMAAASYPAWYPDGKTIGFGDGARNVLYRADIASGAATAVTRQSEVLAGMSSVSPDGRWIAFAGQKNNGQLYNQNDNQIWIVDDKGAARPVEASPGQGRAPSWSPDGTRIAFESDRGSPDRRYAIFLINRDGSSLTQVTDYALNANHPVWSADGKRLVFSWGSEPGRPNGIAVLDLPD